jgi:hypothetical protein
MTRLSLQRRRRRPPLNTFIQRVQNPQLMEDLKARKVMLLAMDAVPRQPSRVSAKT